jgi:UDP-2-acetamido-3-amino-2,3-dideoxy-glucuronate N-acetyltransferase
MKIDPAAIVHSSSIGEGTTVWQFAVILGGAVIGKNCNINCHTFVEDDVVVGNNVTIKSGVYLWNGLRVGDNVFVGPAVVFTNDLRPRSKKFIDSVQTVIEDGASIGANATILAGVRIGKYALVGIGSVVTRDVPDHALVYGSPAKVKGWVDEAGEELTNESAAIWVSKSGQRYRETKNGMVKI